MTKLVLSPEENQRRAIAMRNGVLERQKSEPHAFDAENPIYTVLWNTLTWLLQDNVLLLGYFQQISNGRGVEHVSCFEQSAQASGIVTRTERCLEIYNALTCSDPTAIEDPALRRLIASARLQDAAKVRRDVSSARKEVV